MTREELKEQLGDELCAVCPWMQGDIERRCDSTCEGRYCEKALSKYILKKRPDLEWIVEGDLGVPIRTFVTDGGDWVFTIEEITRELCLSAGKGNKSKTSKRTRK